jgi:hypothetical protein
MALYDVVNGVYRKVTKKYDPVEGVYRKVTKAFDPVDGVYRQYFSSGVPWKKYNCTEGSKQVNTHTLGAEKVLVSGQDSLNQVSYVGLSSYTFDKNAGTVYASGSTKVISKGNPGTAYADGTPGKSINVYKVAASGYYSHSTRTVQTTTSTVVTYTRGSLVGTVRAADGEYPDTASGYTYVTVSDGYTIMKDPSTGKYYAYLQEE